MGFAQLVIAPEHEIVLRFTDSRDDVLYELEKQLFGSSSAASKELGSKKVSDPLSVQRAYSPYRSLGAFKASAFPIVGKVLPGKKKKSSVARFKYTRKASLIRRPFQPEVLGTVKALPQGQTEIHLRQKLSILSRILVETLIVVGVGGVSGGLIASISMPDFMSTFEIVLLALVVPLLLGVGATLIVRYIASEDQPRLFDALVAGFTRCQIQGTQELDAPPDNFFAFAIVGTLGVVLSIICCTYVLHSQVKSLWAQGRYKDTEQISRQLLSVRQFFLGRHHPAVINAKYDIAECLRAQGDFEQALQLYEEALTEFTSSPSVSQSTVAVAVFNIGRCYEALGQLKQADDQYSKAISMIGSMNEGANAKTLWMARIRDRLGIVLMKEGKTTEAQAEEQKVLDIDLAHGDVGQRAAGGDYNELGVLSYKLNKLDQAVTFLNKAIDAKKNDGRVKPYSVGVSQLNLAKVYAKKNMAEQAKNLRTEALTTWATYLGEPADDANQAYKSILEKNKPEYEAEHVDNRSEVLIDGPSRI